MPMNQPVLMTMAIHSALFFSLSIALEEYNVVPLSDPTKWQLFAIAFRRDSEEDGRCQYHPVSDLGFLDDRFFE